MSTFEKYNVYIPEWVNRQLVSDARHFEVVKKDSISPNMNKFLNMLLKNYYEDYTQEYNNIRNKLIVELEKAGFPDADSTASSLLEQLTSSVSGKKEKNDSKVQIKPIKETEVLFLQINSHLGNINDSFSRYFRKMLIRYCEMPMYDREKIIFQEAYLRLISACKAKQTITFRMIWDKDRIYKVIPYEVCRGQDETHNYLLCAEEKSDGTQRIMVLRLNRIEAGSIHYFSGQTHLRQDTIEKLNRTKNHGAQHAINNDSDVIVKVNEHGLRLYNRIYIDRPIYDSLTLDGFGRFEMRFSCAEEQVFTYFRRFEDSSAEIISPLSLRRKMITFHSDALQAYKSV